MARFVVDQGEVHRLGEGPDLPTDTYGEDWIIVDATDEEDASRQADLFDVDAHPAQTEMELFAAAVRAGALPLPRRQDA